MKNSKSLLGLQSYLKFGNFKCDLAAILMLWTPLEGQEYFILEFSVHHSRCNSSMTKIPKQIALYRSHITDVLAISMTLSHFLRMLRTLIMYIGRREFSLGPRISKIHEIKILSVCDTVMMPYDPKKYVFIPM